MKVALYKNDVSAYAEEPPYHPAELYPELRARGFRETLPANTVYGAVRNTLQLLGLDAERNASENWNPLQRYIRPGDRVVLKPNLVLHEHNVQLGQRCLTTHGSVIRAMVDYAFIAGGPEAKIVIADAPVQGADFAKLRAQNGLDAIREFYWSTFRYEIEVIDLRQVHAVLDDQSSLIERVERAPGDPRGYSVIDLGDSSHLRPLDSGAPRYAVGDYDQEVTNRRHRGSHHEYVISNSVLQADAVILLPKYKTHSKVGLTMALKNLVGIVGSKDCLPHHRHGTVAEGGDEFPKDYPRKWLFAARTGHRLQGRVPRWLWRILRGGASGVLKAGTPPREVRPSKEFGTFFPSGSWYGNDTIWRTVDDLNRILHYWSPSKNAFDYEHRRRCLTIVDGIVAMEGNGPLKGSPRPTGVILGGEDPLALDVAAATLAGFDWRKIKMLDGIAADATDRPYSGFKGDVDAIEVVSNVPEFANVPALLGKEPLLPPAGWRSHVEAE